MEKGRGRELVSVQRDKNTYHQLQYNLIPKTPSQLFRQHNFILQATKAVYSGGRGNEAKS